MRHSPTTTADHFLIQAMIQGDQSRHDEAARAVEWVLEGMRAQLAIGRPVTLPGIGKIGVSKQWTREERTSRDGVWLWIRRANPRFVKSEPVREETRPVEPDPPSPYAEGQPLAHKYKDFPAYYRHQREGQAS